MFWKKSLNKSEKFKIPLENPEEARESFRVIPSPDAPVELSVDYKSVSVFNISSGGLCCENSDFKKGSLYSFHLSLSGITRVITGKLEIREVTQKNRCRCKFQNLATEFEDLIHRYTMNRQKEDLDNKNNKLPDQDV